MRQAQPVTPDILLDLVAFLDLTKQADLAFWGVLVLGFYTFFRKSNLIPDSCEEFNLRKQLTRSQVEFQGTVAALTITWSKTIQRRQRAVEIPLFPVEQSPLCLVTVLRALLSLPGSEQSPRSLSKLECL